MFARFFLNNSFEIHAKTCGRFFISLPSKYGYHRASAQVAQDVQDCCLDITIEPTFNRILKNSSLTRLSCANEFQMTLWMALFFSLPIVSACFATRPQGSSGFCHSVDQNILHLPNGQLAFVWPVGGKARESRVCLVNLNLKLSRGFKEKQTEKTHCCVCVYAWICW